MSISIKLHKSYRTVIAVCDSNLIGKKFEEKFKKGIKQLDLRESFYKGQEMTLEEATLIMKSQIKEDSTFNIVGRESIKAAEEAGIIEKNSWQKIKGIPYILILL